MLRILVVVLYSLSAFEADLALKTAVVKSCPTVLAASFLSVCWFSDLVTAELNMLIA